jgi:hypothetical protein
MTGINAAKTGSFETTENPHFSLLKSGALSLSQIILVLIYLVHAFGAFSQSPEYLSMVEVVGFSASVASVLVYMVGFVDLGVALLILFKPNYLVLVYAALWPIVPSILGAFTGGEIEAEFIPTTILAAIIYFFEKNKHSN